MPWLVVSVLRNDALADPPLETALTVSDTVDECVLPPPVPVTVIVAEPVFAVALAVIVIVDVPEPGAAMLAGEKLAVTPEGRPLAESEIEELKPPEMVVVIVEVPDEPCVTVRLVGEAEIVKSAGV